MPTFTNDISDVHIGNNIRADVLSIVTDEDTDTVVPRIRYGYRGATNVHPAATVTGDIRVIVERTDGQDVTKLYNAVKLDLGQNIEALNWEGAAITGLPDVTTVSRVNFYWTQTA